MPIVILRIRAATAVTLPRSVSKQFIRRQWQSIAAWIAAALVCESGTAPLFLVPKTSTFTIYATRR